MSVLVTGGCGFVGLSLAEALLVRSVPVVLLDRREPPAAFRSAVAGAAAPWRCVLGDVTDAAALGEAFSVLGATRVFHGAVITSGQERESSDPVAIVETNILGTIAVLLAARRFAVSRFVYPSSLTVYGESLFDRDVVSEDGTPALPDTLYGITKYASERAVMRLGALWGVSALAGRIGSVFGPWEGETGVRDLVSPLAQIAAAAVRGTAVVLPDAALRREYIYSRDLAEALVQMLLIEAPRHRVYNLSVPADWNDLCRRWCAVLERRFPGFSWRVARAGEEPTVSYYDLRPRARLASTRMAAELHRAPLSPDTALDDYADWLAVRGDFFAPST